ncbi:mannose-p-dolichol utilization defect 1 protein [Plakobranchus ocellatus]|uniref:Mannose-p-dolichol utilization defect 1 protein n=1 Tax=Plakobranchus ocellatus TaxID=259542 RepID=A0AAV4BCI8_9GAST|nr:mannose-p-dolichol utilization defect 1 protein [Plakobranchus ocellatus]
MAGSSALKMAIADPDDMLYNVRRDSCLQNFLQPYVSLFSYCLGYLVIAIGAYGQLPLLFKILRYQSGKSYISIANITTLFVTTTNFVVYAVNRNLPINTWGEFLLQMALYVIIMNLMMLYHGRQRYAVFFMLAYFPLMVVLLWPLVPDVVVSSLMIGNFVILGWRKINWLYKCYKEEGRTYFSTKTSLTLMNMSCVSRLLTSLVDTGDSLLIYFYLQECILNTVLTIQCIHYHRKRQRPSLDRRSSRSSG